MKKENRKMAQERRAAERRRMEKKKKRNRILAVAVPIAVILLLIAVLIADSVRRSNSGNDNETAGSTSSEAAAVTPTEAPSLETDASLTVENGDTVNIDYVGSVDGTEFDGGSTDGMGTTLVIGSGSYIDDFEEQLIGSHPGDEVEVTVTFPEDYGVDDLNGREAVFDVTVNGIYK